MNNEENQRKYREFERDEARWLDSVVRELIPNWMQLLVEKNNKNIIGRVGHFFVDYLYIAKFLKVSITRSQDTVIPGGKGFRQGVDQGYKIAAITTTIRMKEKEVAKQKFAVNIHIKK